MVPGMKKKKGKIISPDKLRVYFQLFTRKTQDNTTLVLLQGEKFGNVISGPWGGNCPKEPSLKAEVKLSWHVSKFISPRRKVMDLPIKCITDSPGWCFQGLGWMTIQSFNVWSTVKGQPLSVHQTSLDTEHMGEKMHGRSWQGEKCACFVCSMMSLLLVAGVERWRLCFCDRWEV